MAPTEDLHAKRTSTGDSPSGSKRQRHASTTDESYNAQKKQVEEVLDSYAGSQQPHSSSGTNEFWARYLPTVRAKFGQRSEATLNAPKASSRPTSYIDQGSTGSQVNRLPDLSPDTSTSRPKETDPALNSSDFTGASKPIDYWKEKADAERGEWDGPNFLAGENQDTGSTQAPRKKSYWEEKTDCESGNDGWDGPNFLAEENKGARSTPTQPVRSASQKQYSDWPESPKRRTGSFDPFA